MSFPRDIRRWSGPAVVVVVFAGALFSPQLRRAPAQLLAVCTPWLTIALLLESLSIGGFIVIFKLVFGDGMSWRRCVVGALRGLGASGLLPAGGLIGPAAAASSVGVERRHEQTARSAVAFVIVTNAPGAIVVVVLGVALALGVGGTQHDPARTLLPAAVGLLLSVATVGLASPAARRCVAVRGGAADACFVLRSADWKLLGALVYYAFDNALLWAAFRAAGYAPAFSVVAMGYVVGSLGAALPLPGGLGATEGGLIGALVLYGAPAGPSAAAVLLYRALTLLLSTLLGAVAWGALPATRRRRTATAINHHERQGATSCSHTSSQSARRLVPH